MPWLVPGAELLAGHHRPDLRLQLLTSVRLRSKAPVVQEGRPVQPAQVPGRVPQLVQRGVRVGVLRRVSPVTQ